MIFGVDYYPEHWDKEEWKEQARLMKEGNFNTVRMGEFAWKLFEKEEGVFDFSLLDEAIDILAKEGIRVILGTPTAAPPKWLANRYDILQEDRYGRKRAWGSRRECCANSADYLDKSCIIVEKMAAHYQNNPNIIAWQIDNEFGCHNSTRCYCESCRKAFSIYLKERYESIDALNKTWGNVFWSLDYDCFDDIILPGYNACEAENFPTFAHNPSLDLEFRRFSSDSWVSYQKMQIEILKKYTSLPITHNLMGHFSDIDYYNLAKDLDFVSWDNYPDNQWGSSEYEYVSMAHEVMRGVKDKNFIVMEEQSGPCGWDKLGSTPRPGQLRLWTYQALAHGGEGIVYFRFRTALFGMEQYWYGVLDHDGIPGRRFYELQQTGQELQKIEPHLASSSNKYETLIVKSYDNVWGHDIKQHTNRYNYNNLLYSYYKANAHFNIPTAVSRESYEKYKVVYMPSYNIVKTEDEKELSAYVENGGTLVLTFRSGTRDSYNNVMPLTVPGVFSKLAGITVRDFDALRRPVPVISLSEIEDVVGTASIWCDIIDPVTAKPLFVYASEYYKDKPAITVNTYGKGRVYYIGCDLDEQTMLTLVAYISKEANVTMYDLPQGVEMLKRDTCVILLNHNEYEVSLSCSGKSLISDVPFSGILPAYGVEVLEATLK